MAGIVQHIENWRAIDGYINYEVSSHGRVRNITTARILKPYSDNHGYYLVKLSKDGTAKNHKIHKLVSFAYCDNINDYNVVDHIDKNKSNNMFNNLRWCTSSENNRNTTIRKDNTSGFKGVSFVERHNTWKATWNDNNL